nr:cytochrome P450 [Nostocaceae cyanobacterium]
LIGTSSSIMMSGSAHKQRRQLVMHSFHGERMRAYGKLIGNATTEVFNHLPLNVPLSARNAMQEISLQVILEAVFGLAAGERCQQIKQLLLLMSDIFRSPLTSSVLFFRSLQQDLGAWSPWGKFVREREQLDQLLYAEIVDRQQHPDSERIDILSLMMSARDEADQPMTPEELRDELMTLMFAGYETTATAMSWGLYWIHRLPEVRSKLLQELDTLEDSSPMDIFRLPYLTAVCNETLRIYPVAMLTFPRVVQAESVELLGNQLEPGTIVVGCIYLTHQREDLYPNPKQFQPERFLHRQFSPYEFMPFGGGVRRCLGEALATFEMKLVLATILKNYELTLTDLQPEQPKRRGVTLGPGKGVQIAITGRRAHQSLSKLSTK